MAVAVTYEVIGIPGAKQMLADFQDPALSRRAQIATVNGAEVIRVPLQREAAKVSKRMSRAVSIRQAQRNRPAAIATFLAKIAFFRHWVLGGTRSHGPRRAKALRFRGRFGWVVVKRVRGVRANPIITRVGQQYEQRIFDAMIRSVARDDQTR